VRFYLGTHQVNWLWDQRFAAVPLFVSFRRLRGRPRLRGAVAPWAMDSGGFTEISMHGCWTTSVAQYVDEVRRIVERVGVPEWIAPQDWMCEPIMLERTGKTIEEHQRLTVANLLELRKLAPALPIVPVLQGYSHASYLRCLAMYEAAGLDLRAEPIVGVGTMCRRQGTEEAEAILRDLAGRGLRVHAFGAKITGLRRYASALESSDSLAWSFNARKHPPMLGCRHKSCSSCPRWALRWREKTLGVLSQSAPTQMLMPW
jgi:hypothetical protein